MVDTINVGLAANDGMGDDLRSAFVKTNAKLAEILAAFNYRGDWATATLYNATGRDYVKQGGLYYLATLTHTSGVFATDLASPKWVEVDLLAFAAQLAGVAAGQGSVMVGHIDEHAGAVPTTVQTHLRAISRKAVLLKSSNTAAENKAVFQAAIASLTRPTKLILPDGYFNIDGNINIGTFVVCMEGGGRYPTQLGCSGVFTYLFGNADATLMEYPEFSNFGIDCAGTVQHGLRFAQVNHALFESLRVTGTTQSAMFAGGYSNDFDALDLFSNTGSGLHLSGVLNNVNVTRSRVYANDGIGILVLPANSDAGLGININCGNAIEANKIAGIIAMGTRGLNIKDNYFERNAATGYNYTNPESILIRADIHLLASTSLILDSVDANSNRECDVSGNHSTAIGVYTALPKLNGFVFSTHANNLRVQNNQLFSTGTYDALVSLYRNKAKSKVVGQLEISGNTENSVNYIGFLDANAQQHATSHLITIGDQPIVKNYADQNFLSWSALAGSTGEFVNAGNFFQGGPTFSLSTGDRQWGLYIDLALYPELKGKWVYFGMWVNDQGASAAARIFVDGQASRGSAEFAGTATWAFESTCQYIAPAATGVTIGVQKIGTGAALLINQPVLAVVGNKYNKYPHETPIWKRAFNPIAGSWQLGDRVVNTPPVVAQPKAWVCTASGVPGTWISEGNL